MLKIGIGTMRGLLLTPKAPPTTSVPFQVAPGSWAIRSVTPWLVGPIMLPGSVHSRSPMLTGRLLQLAMLLR